MQPVIILGSGGHAKVLLDALIKLQIPVVGLTDINVGKQNPVLDVPIIGTDENVLDFAPTDVQLVNGLGSVGLPARRNALFAEFKERGYSFATVVHPSAIIAAGVELGEGVQVMAGAVVQTGCRIGANSIVNTRASVDHDCVIDCNVHIAPGVTLSGGVRVNTGVHIGTGATVIQSIQIGANSLVGSGALVIRDVPANVKVVGVPAKEV